MATAGSIGEQLRLAREEQHIPLREVSDQTRISVHYLEAIEANEFRRLPGGIFNRSFVKAYARYVGVDEKDAVESYMRFMREAGEPGEELPSANYHAAKVYTDTPATRSPVLTVFMAILILAILTAAALAFVKWYQRRSTELLHQSSISHEFVTRDASDSTPWSAPAWRRFGDSGVFISCDLVDPNLVV